MARVYQFTVDRTWQGQALPPSEQTRLTVALEVNHAELEWDAPWPSGVVPRQMPGKCWGLWEYSVVEFFLVSEAGPYVEFEFGPAWHWLALYLSGYRVLHSLLDGVDYRYRREGQRWLGRATVALPASHRWCRANAFFIQREGGERRYCAAASAPGEPDFHRQDCYLTL